MRYIQILSNSGEVQTALDSQELGKPYLAYLEDEHRIDWNTIEPVPEENWVDIRTINNNTPIYNVAWKNGGFGNINDTWFSEKSGLTTDSDVVQGNGWRNGKSADKGWYTYHRMSSRWSAYTCTFLDQYYTENGTQVAYVESVTDAKINTLPTKEINGSTYYLLNLTQWQNWKPLYMPLSTSQIQDTYIEGGILVDIAPKG